MKPYISVFLIAILIACNKPSETKKEEVVEEAKIEQTEKLVQPQKLTKEQQISSAVKAAPMEGRDLATVFGYDEEGNYVKLREGSNQFICVADDPKKDGFEVVAYHRSLEPFMARGRQLNAEGKNREEKERIRESEAISGDLKMPESPATLHIFYGKNGYYDIEKDQIENCRYRYVVYTPFATQETTGLSLSPQEDGHPWLMFPGKYNAHIMITPKD